MSEVESPIQVVQHPFLFRLLQVRRSERIAPHMVRVTLEGETLAGFRSDAADDGARLFFPADPTDASWVPEVDGSKLVFAEGMRPPGREFTPRRYDAEAGEVDFDFVVHEGGAASTWAANAQPGHYLGCSGPRRSRMLTGQIDGYVLAGDETGLPSIARRMEDLPAGVPVIAVIEVANADEEIPITTDAAAQVIWLHRDDVKGDTSNLIADTLRTLEFPEGNIFCWAAGEAVSMRQTRRYLLNERGIPEARARFTGYWKRAVENYDHHLPLDE
ncbi:MAG: siderophore-interacting protein [Thermomicrobiales bacterium]|nr:siderophore-interacting protein [Thermomicrobiales bacterium]